MRFVWSLLVAVVLVLRASSAAADLATDTAEARTLFDRAVERLHAGRYAEARDLLVRSLELSPNPGTAYDLAVACRGTGEILRATTLLESLLADKYGPLRPEQRAEVVALRGSVRAEIGTISVEAAGAPLIELRVDGRRVADLRDGARVEWRVDPGDRLVSVSAPDRVSEERHVHVERGGVVVVRFSVEATAEARFGMLIVEASRPDHEIEIVGIARGLGRLERTVPPGTYRVRVTTPAGRRQTLLTVRARSTVRYQFEASTGSIWASPILWVSSAAVVAGAAVLIAIAASPRHDDPVRDPVYGVAEALRGAR